MRILVWCLALAVCACSGDDSGNGGDAGNGGDGGNGGGDAGVPANSGYVSVTSLDIVSGTTAVKAGSAIASFTTIQGNSSSCTQHAFGACTVFVCPTSGTGTPTYHSAGTVSITGLDQQVTLTPQADNMYTVYSVQDQTLIDGGEAVTVSGAGAEVPAFSISFTAPSRATITSPAKPATNTSLAINRAQDLSVAWSGGGVGKVYVYVAGPQGTGTSVNCGFDASAGSGKVPTAALAMLPAGMGSFSSSSIESKSIDKSDWRIYAQGFFTNVWPDLSAVAATATLQ